MVPIGLQLSLRPPKSKGHIPPVICEFVLQQLPANAVCCGTKVVQVSQAEAKSLNLLGSGRHAEDGEGVAVMQYTGSWLKMTPAELLGCVNAVVGSVLVADSMPGEVSHAHSLAAMIEHHFREVQSSPQPA